MEKQPNLIGAQFHLGPLASALVKLSAQFTLTHQFFEIYTPNVMAHMCWAAAHQAASSSMSNSVLHLQLQNLANLAPRFYFIFSCTSTCKFIICLAEQREEKKSVERKPDTSNLPMLSCKKYYIMDFSSKIMPKCPHTKLWC